MLQTPDGSIWFATEAGAVLYDGKKFSTFDRTKGRLINNDVLSIFRDASETLWFGTRAGVTRFDGHAWSSLDSLDWGLGKRFEQFAKIMRETIGLERIKGSFAIRLLRKTKSPNPLVANR